MSVSSSSINEQSSAADASTRVVNAVDGLISLIQSRSPSAIFIEMFQNVFRVHKNKVWTHCNHKLQDALLATTESRELLTQLTGRGLAHFDWISDSFIQKKLRSSDNEGFDCVEYLFSWFTVERWARFQRYTSRWMYMFIVKHWNYAFKSKNAEKMDRARSMYEQAYYHAHFNLLLEIQHKDRTENCNPLHHTIEVGNAELLRNLIRHLKAEGVSDSTLVEMLDSEYMGASTAHTTLWSAYKNCKRKPDFVFKDLLARVGVKTNKVSVDTINTLEQYIKNARVFIAAPYEWSIPRPMLAPLERAGLDTRRIWRRLDVPFYMLMQHIDVEKRVDERPNIREMFLLLRSIGYTFDKIDGFGNNAWAFAEVFNCTDLVPELAAIVPQSRFYGSCF